MNNKGQSDSIENILGYIGLIISILGFIFIMYLIVSYDNHANKLCKEIGYEKYESKGNIDYCVDLNYDMHKVYINCKFPYNDCEIKKVEIKECKE